MKNIAAIFFLFFLTSSNVSCTNKENNNINSLVTPTNSESKHSTAIKKEENTQKITDKQKTATIIRKHTFPSMMIKNDMRHCEKEGDYSCTPLLGSLIVNRWEASGDKYRRTFIYASPEITYAELQGYLNFTDSDVTYMKGSKPGDPQATILTEWLTCNITFLNKVYDGKDKSVKLKAVLIDNEVKANSDREAEYDKNKGIVRKILDFFDAVHQ